MPSIFIWKAQQPNDSKNTIRYYSGSNWFLEDNDYSSHSYKFLEQIVIPGLNDSVIIFNTKKMPQDWVGSDLLEVIQVSYKKIKEDNYGLLEQIGNWMRFTSREEMVFNSANLQTKFNNIIGWIDKPNRENRTMSKYSNKSFVQKPLQINQIQQEFQKFLIKYTMPVQPKLNPRK